MQEKSIDIRGRNVLCYTVKVQDGKRPAGRVCGAGAESGPAGREAYDGDKTN